MKNDNRTLVVVLLCPCCCDNASLRVPNAVLVSPFAGIDPYGFDIHCVDKDPPFRHPGKDREAATLKEYLDAFRSTIDRALE